MPCVEGGIITVHQEMLVCKPRVVVGTVFQYVRLYCNSWKLGLPTCRHKFSKAETMRQGPGFISLAYPSALEKENVLRHRTSSTGISILYKGVKIMSQTIEQLKNVDIRTVDRETLADIKNVVVNSDLPQLERMVDFIRQVKNPFCYKHGKAVIKISHADTEASLEDRLESYFMSL